MPPQRDQMTIALAYLAKPLGLAKQLGIVNLAWRPYLLSQVAGFYKDLEFPKGKDVPKTILTGWSNLIYNLS